MGKKLNKEQFVLKSISVHGDKYDYTNVVYIGNKINVKIVCPEHGQFLQIPNNHLRGAGCKQCFDKLRGTFKKDSTESFIKKAIKKHDNKYLYTNTKYIASRVKVWITCLEHGDFIQSPADHLYGNGCPKCNPSNKLTFEQITERLLKSHGTSLEFSNYSGATSTKDRITCKCKTHGHFSKRLEDVFQGQGCPKCINPAGYDKTKLGTIYLLNINNTDLYKIGITNKSVAKRYSYADKGKFSIVVEIPNLNGGIVADLEQHILNKYNQYKYIGPSILESGNTEILHLPKLIKELVLWELSL